jgi:hypothetical protein
VYGNGRTRLFALEVALGVLLLAGLFSVRDLPLVDLPQHAVQLTNWLRIDSGAADAAQLELNFRTPYLLAYPILRALCLAVPVVSALKLVFWAAVVLQARALRYLCEQLGHDAWLGLLGYPLGLGYAFCFGFVAFCAALPLAYLAFSQVLKHQTRPSLRSGLLLAVTLALLLIARGVALGFFLAVAAWLLVVGSGTLWQRFWPLLSPPLLGVVWLGSAETRIGPDYLALEPERWLELPAELVGIGSIDRVSTLLGLGVIAVTCASLRRGRPLAFWLPLAAVLLGYGLFPTSFRGVGPLHPRFSCYLVPALLIGGSPRPGAALGLRRAVTVGLATATLLVFCLRLPGFEQEAADYRALAATLPSGLSVRPLIFDRDSRAFPGIPAHLHLAAYYAVEQDGSSGYSFAMYSTSVVRYRRGTRVLMGGGSEWVPERFDAEREAPDYDYFIVRSRVDRSTELFPGPAPAAVLEQRVGEWWGYRRTGRGRELAQNQDGV